MRHKKDLYMVLTPSDTPWACVIGRRLVQIPGDGDWRIYSLAAGKEYGQLVWKGKP